MILQMNCKMTSDFEKWALCEAVPRSASVCVAAALPVGEGTPNSSRDCREPCSCRGAVLPGHLPSVKVEALSVTTSDRESLVILAVLSLTVQRAVSVGHPPTPARCF